MTTAHLEDTARIVAAYVARNPIVAAELAGLIRTVHASLGTLNEPPAPEPEVLVPAVPIKRSLQPEYIVCLEDGRRFRSLKRHLRTAYDMTPEQYRAKWGLRPDYPMVAPSYAAQRSELAKQMGLGRR